MGEAREALLYLCEPVLAPREIEDYILTFCGDINDPKALDETEALRITFYKATAAFIRAFSDVSQHLEEAGYPAAEIDKLNRETAFFAEVRDAIKHYSGEELDIKPFEADMRHLINTYIQADQPTDLGSVDNYSLVELIIETGVHDAIAKKLNSRGKLSKNAVAEGIINNVRKTIIRNQLTDPRFYKKISKLLDDLILQWRKETLNYQEFLQRAEELVKNMTNGKGDTAIPAALEGNREAKTLYNNLPDILALAFPTWEVRYRENDEENDLLQITLKIDRAMREQAPAHWQGDTVKERQILTALHPIMGRNREATLALFELIKQQDGYQ